jgi:hypothetical protein
MARSAWASAQAATRDIGERNMSPTVLAHEATARLGSTPPVSLVGCWHFQTMCSANRRSAMVSSLSAAPTLAVVRTGASWTTPLTFRASRV